MPEDEKDTLAPKKQSRCAEKERATETLKKKLLLKKKMTVMPGAEAYASYRNPRVGILLLHGFTSTPQGLRGLAKRLETQGISVSVPLLAGHGTHPCDLLKTSVEEIVESAEAALYGLQRKVRNVFVAGVSFGGNLALHLAAKHPVQGVIAMSAPIYLKHSYLRPLLQVYSWFKPYLKKRLPKESRKDYHIVERVTYDCIPLPALFRGFHWLKKMKGELGKVTSPVLVLQKKDDFLVQEKSAEYIYQKVTSKKKSLKFIENTYHGIALGPSQTIVADEISRFIRENCA